MPDEIEVGPASELTPGTVKGADRYAVGNTDPELFAVTRRRRHLYADLANGSIDETGCLVCPWHGSKYDLRTGRMVLGPQGVFAKLPGLGIAFKALTLVLPLGRGRVVKPRRHPLRRVSPARDHRAVRGSTSQAGHQICSPPGQPPVSPRHAQHHNSTKDRLSRSGHARFGLCSIWLGIRRSASGGPVRLVKVPDEHWRSTG